MASARDLNNQKPECSVNERACASDFVKCKNDGQMDWKTLAKIITANLLGEVHCASYADYKYGRRTKNFKPDIEWTFSYEEDDILIFKKKKYPDQDLLCFMGRSVIDQPVRSVAAVLRKFESLYIWNKCVTEFRLVQALSESDSHRDIIAYFIHETKRCLIRTKRDLVVFIHSNYSTDLDRFVQVAISTEHPDCPLVNGITRAKCCLGSGWVVEAYEGQESKSLVSFVCNLDPMLLVPPIILNRFMQRQPMSIRHLKQTVMAESLKMKPHKEEFSLKGDFVNGNKKSSESEKEDLSTDLEYSSDDNARSCVLVNNLSLQYEEPIGISEFIGHGSDSKPEGERVHAGKRRQLPKYCKSCATILGKGGKEMLLSSGSCEQCGS